MSGSGRVDRVQIGKKNRSPDHTRSLHDHFPINSTSTRPIPDHFLNFPIASRVLAILDRYPIVFDSQKQSGRKPDRCRPPRPLARPVPDRLIALDRDDLIGSGNIALGSVLSQCDHMAGGKLLINLVTRPRYVYDHVPSLVIYFLAS